MITALQKFLQEKTNGIIHTRKEAIYIVIVGILAVIFIVSLMIRAYSI